MTDNQCREDHSDEDATRKHAEGKNRYLLKRQAAFWDAVLGAIAAVCFAVGTGLLSYHLTESGIEILCIGIIATSLLIYVSYRHIHLSKRVLKFWPFIVSGAASAALLMRALYAVIVLAPSETERAPEFVKQAIWDKQKAIMSFVKTESPCVVPDQGDFEAVFWFRNRPGGNVASSVQVSNLEILTIWPDVHVCNVGSAQFGGPRDIGPGDWWNLRIILSPWMVQKQDVQVRASVDYIAGTDPTTGKDRPASTPFCQELDKTTGQLRWMSCLGKPTPVCTRLAVE